MIGQTCYSPSPSIEDIYKYIYIYNMCVCVCVCVCDHLTY